jgi:hypothetical protein
VLDSPSYAPSEAANVAAVIGIDQLHADALALPPRRKLQKASYTIALY